MYEEAQDWDDIEVISTQEEIESKSNTHLSMIKLRSLKDCEIRLKQRNSPIKYDSPVSFGVPQIKECEVVLKRLDFPDHLSPNPMLKELKRDH